MGDGQAHVPERTSWRSFAYWGATAAAVLVGFVAFVALFFAWYWTALLFVVALTGAVFLLVRATTRSQRILGVITLVVLSAWGLFLWTFVRDAIVHDRVRSRVSAAVCTTPPTPPGGRILHCTIGGVENPANGNNCGYPVTLMVETSAASARKLADTYRMGNVPVIPDVVLVGISIDPPENGRATVALLSSEIPATTCGVTDARSLRLGSARATSCAVGQDPRAQSSS